MSRARHAWVRESMHNYRCSRCGCAKTNTLRPGRAETDPGRWVAVFEWAGQRREGLTPPCPGHLPGAAPAAEPVPLALDLAPVDAPPAAVPAPAAPGMALGCRSPLRPIAAVLPLLAGPPDAAADAYRAWLAAPRPERGSCGYCRYSQLIGSGPARVCCGHPACAVGGRLVSIDDARASGSFPPGKEYDPGGACGPSARLFSAPEPNATRETSV